jgi:RecA-family ATPase
MSLKHGLSKLPLDVARYNADEIARKLTEHGFHVPQVALDPPSKEKESTLRFFSAGDVQHAEPPPREWLVEGMIPMGDITLLSGDGGTGKSLLSLQLASAVADGSRWMGHDVTKGRAMFVSAEDGADELHRRIYSVSRAEGGAMDLTDLSLASLAGETALLCCVEKDGVLMPSPLFLALEKAVAEQKPALLVLDTAADLYAGNENDRSQVRQFVGMLRGLAIRHSLALVLLFHPSQSGMKSGSGTSGSTAWNNSCRSRLYFERIFEGGKDERQFEPDPDARVLRVMKANYSRTGAEIVVRWQDGVFVPSAEGNATGESREEREDRAEDVFLRLLRRYNAENRPVNASAGTAYAPTVFSRDGDRGNLRRDDFKGAMDRLLRGKRIRNESYGPPSKIRTRLTPVC